jgi:predicted nucleic acid-binding protein
LNLIDSSVWIDFFRRKTPPAAKRQIEEIVDSSDVATCEPVLFELLRAASRTDAPKLQDLFATIPVLPTPGTLWRDARILGQKCAAAGHAPAGMDLLIAQVALDHDADLTTFDRDFEGIASICRLPGSPSTGDPGSS